MNGRVIVWQIPDYGSKDVNLKNKVSNVYKMIKKLESQYEIKI